jgi:hypothetical protein
MEIAMNGKICLALAAAFLALGPGGTLAQAPAPAPAPAPPPAPAPAPAAPASFEISLSPDKLIYQQNDAIVFTFVSAQPCTLTLSLIDSGGQVGVLFPNQFERDSAVEANKEVRIGEGKVAFKLTEKGRQIVIATCTAANGARGRTELRIDVD